MSSDSDSSTRCFLCRGIVFSVFSSGVMFEAYTDHLKKEHKVVFNFKWIINKSLEDNSSEDSMDIIYADLDDSKNEDSDFLEVHSMDSEDGFDSLFDSLEDTSDDENGEIDAISGDPVKASTKPIANETFSCPECNRLFKRSFHLKLHLKRGHNKDKVESFFCDVCGKALASKQGFDKHLITHTKKHLCEICKEEYTTVPALKVHIKAAHSIKEIKQQICNMCDKEYSTAAALKLHAQTAHTKHTCEICQEVCSTADALKVHFSTAHPIPDYEEILIPDNKLRKNACMICNKENPTADSLKLHIQTTHYIYCEICQKGCTTADAFKMHLSTAHPTSNNEDNLTFDNKELKNSCKISNKENPIAAALKLHTSTVHDKHPCDICERDYSTAEALKLHLKTVHTKQSCDTCEELKLYATVDTLKLHIRTHTEGKSHNCEHCGKVFAQETSLKWHKKVCIGIKKDSSINDKIKENNLENDMKEMIKSAEEWIRSKSALNHMAKIMTGEFRSKRHKLFLDKKQRELSGGLKPSKLYQLSNPGFLGGGGQGDSAVLQFLVDNVFKVNFELSDPRLKKIGIVSGFAYATTVLFPETFLHRNQVQKGLSRKLAEKDFLQISVTEDERKSFDKEIREAKESDDTEMDSDNKDDWVDTKEILEEHSENSGDVIIVL